MENLPEFLVMGVPIVVVVPMLVQKIKDFGLADRFTGLASMVVALALILLVSADAGTLALSEVAGYILAAILYGLASNGVYSQVKMFAGR